MSQTHDRRVGLCEFIDVKPDRLPRAGILWIELRRPRRWWPWSTALLARSMKLDVSTVDSDAAWVRFIIDPPAHLTAGTVFHVVLGGTDRPTQHLCCIEAVNT